MPEQCLSAGQNWTARPHSIWLTIFLKEILRDSSQNLKPGISALPTLTESANGSARLISFFSVVLMHVTHFPDTAAPPSHHGVKTSARSGTIANRARNRLPEHHLQQPNAQRATVIRQGPRFEVNKSASSIRSISMSLRIVTTS